MLRKMMYQQIERFHECWVPDIENSNGSLSGSLGHPSKMPKVPVHYIGWLTRFTLGKASAVESAYKLLIILSGPEPQRTMLEQMLLEQLTSITATVLMVRGLPGETNIPSTPAHIKVVNHLPAAALQTAMQQSEFVLARGGYSTLMDAFTLQKKCVFVPTPGQTEQVYLCNMLHQKKAALCFAQPSFQLSAALKLAADFSFQMPTAPNPDLLSDFVRNWLLRL
jgi:UDP-N-acetylglucosamine transferase subunit ALG13